MTPFNCSVKLGFCIWYFWQALRSIWLISVEKRPRHFFWVYYILVPQVLGTLGGLFFFDFSFWRMLGSVFSSHSFLALLIAKRLGLTEWEMAMGHRERSSPTPWPC